MNEKKSLFYLLKSNRPCNWYANNKLISNENFAETNYGASSLSLFTKAFKIDHKFRMKTEIVQNDFQTPARAFVLKVKWTLHI